MTEMSAAEAATVARFENAEPAPESWDGGLREAIARTLYEADCAYNGDSGVSWDDRLLGPEVLGLRNAYRASAAAVLAMPEVAVLRAKAAAADRVRELAAEAWDDGFEAGHQFTPHTNGVPHDPPRNPYDARVTDDHTDRGRC